MKSYKILLVDDDPFIVKSMGLVLEGEGYHVTTADSGSKALEIATQKKIDLVLTDLVMDPVDGLYVLKNIKALDPETMVIILTGYGCMNSAIEALRLDADDYMLKPCEPGEISFRVSRCFEKLELKRKIKAYEKIKESENHLRSLIQKIQAAVIVHGSDSRICTGNVRAQQLLGLTEDQMSGKTYPELTCKFFSEDETTLPSNKYPVNQVLETHTSLRDYVLGIYRHDKNDIIWGLFSADPVFDVEGKIYQVIVTFMDISEQKRGKEALRESEKKLRFLSASLLNAQERERKRISLELHDDLGQSLAVLKLQLRSIQQGLKEDQKTLKGNCEETLQYVDQIIENMRRLAHDLSPSVLEDIGLSAALRSLIDEFVRHSHIKISRDMRDIDHLLPREAQIVIYRIFQEAFTNISKYAQTTHVSVIIKEQQNNVSFSIEDHGIGFDINKVENRILGEKGLGLAAMNERARMLGGFLEVSSQKDRGTRIKLTIPIDKEEKSEALSYCSG